MPKNAAQVPAPEQSLLAVLRQDARTRWIAAGLLAFCFLTKVVRLDNPKDFYFDEVYHAYTATLYVHGDKEAYNPWAKAPEGRAVEWTHPPLSKLIMAGMMKVFGENSFGWRVGSVVFGTAATAATAVLAFELFQSPLVALIALFAMTVETLVFAQSRVAMNDSYFVFFMLLTLIFYVRWKRRPEKLSLLYLTGLSVGLAGGTKWTAMYVLGILIVDQARELVWKGVPLRRFPLVHLVLALGALPAVVYVSSYAQLFLLGGGWSDFKTVQDQMWGYHTTLKATHAYGSKPWQWLLNIRPVWMYVDYSTEGRTGHLYNLGNSVIQYAGLVAVYLTLFKERNQQGRWPWEKWFAVLAYFSLWLPWVASPRVMLYYHYMPAVPILCVLLARWLGRLMESGDADKARSAKAVLGGAFAWFVLAYPLVSAVPIPRSIADFVYQIFS